MLILNINRNDLIYLDKVQILSYSNYIDKKDTLFHFVFHHLVLLVRTNLENKITQLFNT